MLVELRELCLQLRAALGGILGRHAMAALVGHHRISDLLFYLHELFLEHIESGVEGFHLVAGHHTLLIQFLVVDFLSLHLCYLLAQRGGLFL